MCSEQNNDMNFYQGNEKLEIQKIELKISELSSVKNVSFLFGAGTSSGAIPAMIKMQEEITAQINTDTALADIKELYLKIKDNNLEKILGILYAKKYYLEGVSENIDIVNKLINYIETQMFNKINVDIESNDSQKVLELYKLFYQKVALRNKDLSRINIFTTNNDLFNERALDNLNINFNNGFGGGLERVFNPARFQYTFSRKIDPNLEKFEPLENMVYLYKLHGSISWIEKDGNSLFNIHEIPISNGAVKDEDSHVLIYPTPLKQNQSLGSPYSDLIREFKTKLAQPNSVLFIVGYSFSDEHLNNIIYQSLASNSSISIVIFGEYPDCPLSKIKDNRIYRIYGTDESGNKIHYFDNIVKNILPNSDENKEKTLLDEFVSALSSTESADS